jgi:hypothetical protein
MDLQKYQIDAMPNAVYYVPNFVSAEEEQELLQKVSRQKLSNMFIVVDQ